MCVCVCAYVSKNNPSLRTRLDPRSERRAANKRGPGERKEVRILKVELGPNMVRQVSRHEQDSSQRKRGWKVKRGAYLR